MTSYIDPCDDCTSCAACGASWCRAEVVSPGEADGICGPCWDTDAEGVGRMSAIEFTVHGTPAPQGSKKHVGNGVMVESSAKVRPWRQDVKYAALEAHDEQCGDRVGIHFLRGTPVAVTVTFYLPRPKGHYRTGANAHLLRDASPKRPSSKPDIDKLLRSTLDALGEAGIWADDSQVAGAVMSKRYADHDPVGAHIHIQEIA